MVTFCAVLFPTRCLGCDLELSPFLRVFLPTLANVFRYVWGASAELPWPKIGIQYKQEMLQYVTNAPKAPYNDLDPWL